MIVTFTNLFPSSVRPTHGLFVRERMRRVVARLGVPWQVVAPVPRPPWPLRAWGGPRPPLVETVDGVPVHHPRYRHWPGISQRRQADRVVRGARPVVRQLIAGGGCVLDAHYLWPDGVAAAAIGRELGVPYVLTARGSDLQVLGRDPVVAARIRDAAAGAAACGAVSAPLCGRFGALAGREVELWRNGVDLERFAPGDRSEARRALGLPAEGPLALGVGRLVASKGFHRAVPGVLAVPGARLVLIGDGPRRRSLARQLGERGLLLGPQPPERVALAYRACDLLVLPTDREGWPNVVTEALASGMPVVATAVGGIPGLVTDPAAGELVPPGDDGAFADAVRRWLVRPADRSQVRALAVRYSWDEPVARLAEILSPLLSS